MPIGSGAICSALSVMLTTSAFATNASAGALICEIDFYRAPTSGGDSMAVVGGAVTSDTMPVYVTVTNGRATYTTLTDRNGRWNVAFKLLSGRLSAEAWSAADVNVECSD